MATENAIMKLFQNCDMKKNIAQAKTHIISYMNIAECFINMFDWNKILPESKILCEFNKSTVVFSPDDKCRLYK
jgi:hypothetical protein